MNIKHSLIGLLTILLLIFSTQAQINFEKRTKLEQILDNFTKNNDIKGGIAYFDKLIDAKQNLFEAYVLRSKLKRMSQDYPGVISDVSSALALKQTDSELYFIRATVKKFTKDYSGALQDLDLAQQYGYDVLNILFSKAEIKELLKDFDGAIAEYQAVLNSDPNSINSAMEIARVSFENKNQTNQAIQSLETYLIDFVKRRNGKTPKVPSETVENGLSTKSSSGMPVKTHITSNVTSNSFEDFKRLNKISEEAKTFAEAYILVGLMYMKTNDFDSALKNLDKAIEVDKNQYNAYGLKGKIYFARKEYDKSLDAFNKAISMANIETLYFDRGILLLTIGKNKEAQKDFDLFLKQCPECKSMLDKKIEEVKTLKTK